MGPSTESGCSDGCWMWDLLGVPSLLAVSTKGTSWFPLTWFPSLMITATTVLPPIAELLLPQEPLSAVWTVDWMLACSPAKRQGLRK